MRPCSAAAALVAAGVVVVPLLHQLPVPHAADLAVAAALDSMPHWPALLSDSMLRRSDFVLFNPEGFHGHSSWTTSGSSDGFFEGWYYKIVTSSGETLVAIPGAIWGEDGFAFVMFVDASSTVPAERYQLHKYPLDALEASRAAGSWSLTIGPNRFDSSGFTLALDQNGQTVRGTARAASTEAWPASLLMPDIMGPFAWLPGMECRHGVISLDSPFVDGQLQVNSRAVELAGGAAYVEKDWGSAFPRTWVWIQASHFAELATAATIASSRRPVHRSSNRPVRSTLLLSVASIPFPSDVSRDRGLHSISARFGTYDGGHFSHRWSRPRASAASSAASGCQTTAGCTGSPHTRAPSSNASSCSATSRASRSRCAVRSTASPCSPAASARQPSRCTGRRPAAASSRLSARCSTPRWR